MPEARNARIAESWGWEQCALGTLIYDPEKMDQATTLLPSDFSGSHQRIFSEMISLHSRGILEPRALIEKLREENRLDSCSDIFSDTSGEQYILQLVSQRGAALDEYIRNVKGLSGKRQLEAASALIAADALDRHLSFSDALDSAERRLVALRRDQEVVRGTSIGDLFRVFLDRVHNFIAGTFVPAYVPQIPEIREMCQYLEDDEYVVAAARPGDGKSSTMRYDFLKSALSGSPTLIVNLENNELEYAKAAIAIELGIDTMRLKDPRLLGEDELRRVVEKADELSSVPWHIISMAGPSANEIDRSIRPYIREHSIALIGIDYVQLVYNGIENKNDNLSLSSQTFRTMTRKYRVPMIVNAQLNRQIEHRGVNAQPLLSDLRDSGTLEQDATQVWFYRSMWADPTDAQIRMFPQNITESGELVPRAMPYRTVVGKNRNGPTGVTRPYLWDKATGIYSGLRTETHDGANLQ